MKRNLAIHNV